MGQNHAAGFTREDTKIIKAVAVILMLVHHLFFFPDRISDSITYIPLLPGSSYDIEVYLANFGKICVFIFTFLSGYGVHLSCQGKNSKDQTIALTKNIINLYKQYWTVFIVFIPICIICGVSQVSPRALDVFLNFTGIQISFNGEWWFITQYIFLLLLYPALYQISSRFQSVFSEFLTVAALATFVRWILPVLVFYSWASALAESVEFGIFRLTADLLPLFWMGLIFAKYGVLSAIKGRFSGNLLYSIAAFFLAAFCVYIRNESWNIDIVLVPFFIASITVALNHKWGTWPRKILAYIGAESTFIWLTHSMFCYHLCQELVFMPKYSVLIVIWLIIICLVTAKLLRLLMKAMGLGWAKIKPLFETKALEN